jgi:pantoate--beta-alanine ligase
MSSRNRFLTPEERAAAPALYAALCEAARKIAGGAPVTDSLHQAETAVTSAGMRPDYLALVDAQSLKPLEVLSHPARIISAARLGTVRLLDNVPV